VTDRRPTPGPYPAAIADEAQLDDLLSEPTPAVIETLRALPGDVVVLGVGGKMGPTLARMARRALERLGRRDRVIGVARFSDPALPRRLQAWGIVTVVCDLLDRDAVVRLPDAPNVIFMAGQKFGTTRRPDLTWALNTLVPAHAAERYAHSRIVAFSTGCVYPLVPVAGGASREDDALGPPGDYANSCVGRERVLAYCSRRHGTPVLLLRLSYAVEMRYGVLLDIAQQVWRGDAVDVTMGHVNMIWQGDANAFALQALAHTATPPCVLNVSGPDILSVRDLADAFGRLLSRPVRIAGAEAPTAWIADTSKARRLLGPPRVPVEPMMRWVADWVRRGGPTLGKPTHFEVRDGEF
jgi:nucleoside-diphosphate-sugar epimerase